MPAPDLLVFDAPAAIKATANGDGTVTLSGPAVVFDAPGTRNRDLAGEYFTAETYYGAAAKGGAVTLDTLFHHGIPLEDTKRARRLADAILAETTLTKTGDGWLASLVLPMREDYEEEIAELAEAGKLGWSTGSAGHVVRKAADGMIERWPFVEVSLTPTPAEPRTFAVPVKSLLRPEGGEAAAVLKALRAARAELREAPGAHDLTHALRAARLGLAA